MKVIVTGGAGFIGSYLASNLINKYNYDVTVIDDLSKGDKKNVHPDAKLIIGKCEDPNTYKSINKSKFDIIFHFAGQSSGEKSFENPFNDLNSNTASTLQLLTFCVKSGCRRFVFASTMSVYGDQKMPFKESFITKPLSFYGVGKVASELYCSIYRKFGLKISILRLFNVYGPGQDLSDFKQGMISIYLGQALLNNEIIIKGSSERFRDFIFIDDVIDATNFIINNQKSDFEIFNICTSQKTYIGEIITIIENSWPQQIKTNFIEGTPGDQFGSLGDNSKLFELGWNHKVDFYEGINKTISWALKNRNEG